MKWIFKNAMPVFVIYLLAGCNNNTDSSPYNAVLEQPPYASVSDSIRIDRGNAELYYHRGLLLKNNNLPEPAVADFKKAWSLKVKEEYAANASALLLENKPDSAVIFITDALKKIPNSIFLKLDLARAYNDLNKKEEALTVCNEIIQSAPGQIDALMMK